MVKTKQKRAAKVGPAKSTQAAPAGQTKQAAQTTQKTQIMQMSGSMYHIICAIQKVSLLVAAGSAIILWSTLISIAHGYSFIMSMEGPRLANLEEWNRGIADEITRLTHYSVAFALVALGLTLLLLKIPRASKFDKKMVVDGVIVSLFLLSASLWCQPLFRFVLAHITA